MSNAPLATAAVVEDADLNAKAAALDARLAGLGSVLVAYSGGVDSAFLAVTAARVLDSRSLSVTADSASYPERHRDLAIEIARAFNLRHEIIHTDEIGRPDYRANPANRCYYCKHELYTHLSAIARARGFAAIVDGSNADDRGDYRPGRQAAREFGVLSPLDESGLTKADIRSLARRAGMSSWDEPASACLSSRIPYGTPVTIQSLSQIEQAENFLRDAGFTNVRVRHHTNLARIEVDPTDLPRLLQEPLHSDLIRHFKSLGYTYVTMDLQGFRSGSGNETLTSSKTPL